MLSAWKVCPWANWTPVRFLSREIERVQLPSIRGICRSTEMFPVW